MAWVLIMEDETQVRVLAEEILKEAGHHTLTAANVAEALALVRAYELINVLFADNPQGPPADCAAERPSTSLPAFPPAMLSGDGTGGRRLLEHVRLNQRG